MSILVIYHAMGQYFLATGSDHGAMGSTALVSGGAGCDIALECLDWLNPITAVLQFRPTGRGIGRNSHS